ncbi:hydroxypyruvate isomerase family protein [Ruegeria profundi]|uniref:hydroxypyruvate isomerase family protein n=1 Tax=Ruegeria profundi TaxID=1685378 RepID=UPI001CD6CC5C|nr:TIM barrel protein [Ruegeria profundi]MCA0930747.1 TIM barrel protein [Ruegeria profundi]
MGRLRFSANLGFLWTDRSLTRAIHAAKAAGFDAVELHWPYETTSTEVAGTLRDLGIPCLGLNTRRGDVASGENGLAALPGREAEARAAIDEALAYGAEIGAANVHVMAGYAEGNDANTTFIANLTYACESAAARGMCILIEPLNRHDAPGYFLKTTGQALSIIEKVGHNALRLMFDCYHVQRTEGDISCRLTELMPHIGHIQIASVPDRGAPDHGEIDFAHVFALLDKLGYDRPIGAEYKPQGDTEANLSWLGRAR